MNHSIPGAVGLFIRARPATFAHGRLRSWTRTPIDGITTDFGALARFSERAWIS